jgi:hypothetical protein
MGKYESPDNDRISAVGWVGSPNDDAEGKRTSTQDQTPRHSLGCSAHFQLKESVACASSVQARAGQWLGLRLARGDLDESAPGYLGSRPSQRS